MKARLAYLVCAALAVGGAAAQQTTEKKAAPKAAASKKAGEPELPPASAMAPLPSTSAAPASGATTSSPSAVAPPPTPPATAGAAVDTTVAPGAATPTADAQKKESVPSTSTLTPPPSPPPVPPDSAGVRTSSVAPIGTGGAPLSVETLLRDLRITDVLIVLFALIVLFFAFRTSSAVAKLRGFVERQGEDARRMIETSEKAAEASRRSAEATEQTLAALRDTSERQLRAYVTVKQFVQTAVKDERDLVQGWLFQVVWQNTGSTPTRGFRYWAMLREFDRTIPDDFDFTPAGLKDFAAGELGPNASVNSPPLFVSQQQIARLQDGSRRALVLGQADYHDAVRDGKHETRFCVELVLVNDPNAATGSPFSFSYFPKYNTAT